jgi:hypothetical protein
MRSRHPAAFNSDRDIALFRISSRILMHSLHAWSILFVVLTENRSCNGKGWGLSMARWRVVAGSSAQCDSCHATRLRILRKQVETRLRSANRLGVGRPAGGCFRWGSSRHGAGFRPVLRVLRPTVEGARMGWVRFCSFSFLETGRRQLLRRCARKRPFPTMTCACVCEAGCAPRSLNRDRPGRRRRVLTLTLASTR